MPRRINLSIEVREVIDETTAELVGSCKITLYDVYGSTDGWYIADFKTQAEENEEYEPELAGVSHRAKRSD